MDISQLLGHPALTAFTNGNPNQFNSNQPGPNHAWGLACEAIVDDILLALDDIKPQGSFSGSASLKAPDFADRLGLHVEGVGNIGVPLREEQARQLIAQCRQAPFGKGSDTIVDTSVRNTWELDASQFRFYNDAWARTVDQCVAFVKQALGITSPIIADPYKMLIYEKGAMFKPHTDTEKIPGMFGTLVICLPSPHTGGDLVVRHRGKEKTYKTSENQPSVLCWYSDVHHEILPVMSGYRWVLTYNLAISPDLERPSAALLQPNFGKLQQAMSKWLEHLALKDSEQAANDDVPHLYYLMEHEYTEASIALRALKTTDLARVQCLRDLSAQLGFDVFLAVLEKSEMGDVEHEWGMSRGRYYDDDGLDWHELDNVYESSVSIKKLVDLDGALLRSGMNIDEHDLEKNLIPGGDPFEGVNDRNEDYEGFMGNSGPTATHFYRTSIAVLVPRSSTDEFLTQGLRWDGAQAMLGQYATKYLPSECEPARRQSAVKTMRRLARTAWKKTPTAYTKPDRAIVLEVLKGAMMRSEYDLFNDVFGLVGTASVDPIIFGLVKDRALAGCIDVSKIKKSMFDHIMQGDIGDRSRFLQFLRPSEKENNAELEAMAVEIATLSVEKLEDVFKSGFLRESDGFGFMSMVNRPQDYDLFKTRVLPVLEGSTNANRTFVLGALQILSSCASKNGFPQPESLDIVKRLSESVISALDITKLRTEAALLALPAAAPQPYSYYSSRPASLTPAQRTQTLDPCALTEFVETCLTHNWDDLLISLTDKITTQSPSIPRSEFEPLWLTFLHELFLGSGTPSPRYKTLTLSLLNAYLTRHIGREPAPSASLTLPPTRCPCSDCRPLNAFLASTDRRVDRYTLGKERRKHLHRALEQSAAGSMVTHVTEHNSRCGTLVVTKVGTHAQRERAAWEARVAGARKRLLALGEEGALGKVIGEGEYERVLGMGELFLSGQPLLSRGVKRKAEGEVEVVVIDSD